MVNPWILVPLYIYPSSNAWKTLYTAIEANTNVNFKVIINPASGPGGGVGSVPDSNYIKGISKLNGYKNIDLLGYVDTAYATRRYTAATTDVDTYAAWSKYTKADIHVDGIFFDDNPNSDAVSPLSYLTNITKYTRSKFGNSAHISLNPGTYVSEKWYNIADSIVAFEDQFSDFKDSSPNVVSSAAHKAKSVFIVHSFSGSATQQDTLVKKISQTGGIAGSFITSGSNYDTWSKNFPAFVKSVAALQGSGSTSNAATQPKTGSGKTSKRDEELADNGSEADLDKRASISSSITTKPTSKPTPKPTNSAHGKHHSVDRKKPGHTLKTTKPITGTKSVATKTASHTPSNTAGVGAKHISATPTKSVIQATASHTTSAHARRWHARGWTADAAAQPIAV